MAALAKIITEYTAKGANIIPGIVCQIIDKSGKKLFELNSGHASHLDSAPKVDSNTIYRIASSTKLLTCIAALQLIERGKLSLDTSVKAQLPEIHRHGVMTFTPPDKMSFAEPTKDVTVRMLLSHTSGQGYDFGDPRLQAWRKSQGQPVMSMTGNVTKQIDQPLLFNPGDAWMYGSSTDALGVLIERVSGQSLEEYMKAHIWEPLGMDSTTFFIAGDAPEKVELRKRLVMINGRNAEGQFIQQPSLNGDNPAEASGGGGLYSSTADYVKLLFDLLQDEPKVISKKGLEHLWTPALNAQQKATMDAMVPMMLDLLLPGLLDGTEFNQSLGGLLLMSDNKNVGKTTSTLAWAGALGSLWLINRELGVAGWITCQMFPPGDAKFIEVEKEFIKAVFELGEKNCGK